MRPTLTILLLILISAAISGCATSGASSDFCTIAKPIYWSKGDTRATKEQVDSYNRAGKAVCGWGKK